MFSLYSHALNNLEINNSAVTSDIARTDNLEIESFAKCLKEGGEYKVGDNVATFQPLTVETD